MVKHLRTALFPTAVAVLAVVATGSLTAVEADRPAVEQPVAGVATPVPDCLASSGALAENVAIDDAALFLLPPAQPTGGLCSITTSPPCGWCPQGRLMCECLCNLTLSQCEAACPPNNPWCIFDCVQEASCCHDGCVGAPC